MRHPLPPPANKEICMQGQPDVTVNVEPVRPSVGRRYGRARVLRGCSRGISPVQAAQPNGAVPCDAGLWGCRSGRLCHGRRPTGFSGHAGPPFFLFFIFGGDPRACLICSPGFTAACVLGSRWEAWRFTRVVFVQ
ncbi:hypothetical protein JB92DRAFT_583413 [Gautieria morchelliformis]|nr:hypothetical protein JB92DRAFT_583413 [Gautieria morchelliformis]